MDLWNGVEKDKVVQAARRAAAARNRTRTVPAQPPLKKVMIVVILAIVTEVEVGTCAAQHICSTAHRQLKHLRNIETCF